jgi:hypothetical protein
MVAGQVKNQKFHPFLTAYSGGILRKGGFWLKKAIAKNGKYGIIYGLRISYQKGAK